MLPVNLERHYRHSLFSGRQAYHSASDSADEFGLGSTPPIINTIVADVNDWEKKPRADQVSTVLGWQLYCHP